MKKLAGILSLVFVITSLFGTFAFAAADDEVNIPDPKLKAALLSSGFNTTNDNKMTEAEMKAVTYLPLSDMGITDLTGIEKCTKLYKIDISGNKIQSLEPLGKLKYASLVEIDAVGCGITDLTPIKDLGTREYKSGTNIVCPNFNFADNEITDISPLAVVSNEKYPKIITKLNLSGNKVADLSPLATITTLEKLEVADTDVTDISVVKSLTNLSYLDISKTDVSDISAVADCTMLESFIASKTKVTSVAPLANLENIIMLHLDGNKITDLPTIAKFMNSDVEFKYINTNDYYTTYAATKLYEAKKGTKSVASLKKNRDLIYLGVAGSRFYVAYEGKIGYVNKTATKVEFDKYLKRKAKKAIVAVKKPNSKKKTKVKFKKNKKITLEAQVGNYYKVANKNAWVAASWVKK